MSPFLPNTMAPIFSSLPTPASFYTPTHLTGAHLIRALAAVSADIIAAAASTAVLQRCNSRTLTRKIRALHSLFDFLKQNPPPAFSAASTLCFEELYTLLHRSKALLDYCRQSSRLWVLLLNRKISGYFCKVTRELCTLLDVLPSSELGLNADVEEQLELLRRHAKSSKHYVDPEDENLRVKIHSFLDGLENSQLPSRLELEAAFVGRLGIRNARRCQDEMEFLEEAARHKEEQVDVEPAVIEGVIALTRYCRFLLFGCRPDALVKNSRLLQRIGGSFANAPKDLCCPISLELMIDPVIVSSGQTYDRKSIVTWMDEGNGTCPSSGQVLDHNYIVPNLALRSLISYWCSSNGVAYDPQEDIDDDARIATTAVPGRAAIGANKATVELLVQHLKVGPDDVKLVAVRELLLLTKTSEHNRLLIAETGAVPALRDLLASSDPSTQENSITVLLNLSIHKTNKSRVAEEDGCLSSIVDVLLHGCTVESRENAAATLFSLSTEHRCRKLISNENGALEALVGMLRDGTPGGRKDAVRGLYNISTHEDCCERMVESGVLAALVAALRDETVVEEAAGAVALLVRKKVAAERIAWDEAAVGVLAEVMRRGKATARENEAAAMAEMCRSGGEAVAEAVARTPALGAMVTSLMLTGTKRARRKAAVLRKVLKRFEERKGGFYGAWRWTDDVPVSMSRHVLVV